MRGGLRQNLLATLASVLVFLGTFLGLKWTILVSAPLALGTFAGVYLVSKPRPMLGDINLEALANGRELQELYVKAMEDMETIRGLSHDVGDPEIRKSSQKLAATGLDILRYLERNPRDLSESRHFLDYYVGAAIKILDNYVQLKRANISQEKFDLIRDRTQESLDLLIQVFARQRDGYHKDRLMALEVESELLEKTLKLGGEEK